MKRTELKRGKPLQRKTPLARGPFVRLATSLKKIRPKQTAAERRGRKVVYGRSGGICEIGLVAFCTGLGEEWHHRRNRTQGGTWDPSNGLHVCHGCHAAVTRSLPAWSLNGWWVKSTEDWARKPVCRFGDWVVLDDDGDFQTLRKWVEGEPEPADRPAVVDREGVVHAWTDDGDGLGEKCWNQLLITHHDGYVTGGHTCEDWSEILADYGPVREATADEAERMLVRQA